MWYAKSAYRNVFLNFMEEIFNGIDNNSTHMNVCDGSDLLIAQGIDTMTVRTQTNRAHARKGAYN